MKLVVGLGNPGKRYQGTRHNVGFCVVQEVARRHTAETPRHRFQGDVVEVKLGEHRVLLLCPQTYMNRSGASVSAARDFYKIELHDLLVVCDDLNLPLAKLRIRAKGSSGGQKGLDDIIQRLGTQEFPRLRIGIGSAPENWDAADYVLSKFTPNEQTEVESAVLRAADAVEVWAREGTAVCMNRYNADQ